MISELGLAAAEPAHAPQPSAVAPAPELAGGAPVLLELGVVLSPPACRAAGPREVEVASVRLSSPTLDIEPISHAFGMRPYTPGRISSRTSSPLLRPQSQGQRSPLSRSGRYPIGEAARDAHQEKGRSQRSQELRESSGGRPPAGILVLDTQLVTPSAQANDSSCRPEEGTAAGAALLHAPAAYPIALQSSAPSPGAQLKARWDPRAERVAAGLAVDGVKPAVLVAGLKPSPVLLSRGPGGCSPLASSTNCGFTDVCCHARLRTRSGLELAMWQRGLEQEERTQLAHRQAQESAGIKFRSEQAGQSRKLYSKMTEDVFNSHKREKDRAREASARAAAQRDIERAARTKVVHDRVVAQAQQAAATAAKAKAEAATSPRVHFRPSQPSGAALAVSPPQARLGTNKQMRPTVMLSGCAPLAKLGGASVSPKAAAGRSKPKLSNLPKNSPVLLRAKREQEQRAAAVRREIMFFAKLREEEQRLSSRKRDEVPLLEQLKIARGSEAMQSTLTKKWANYITKEESWQERAAAGMLDGW
jgi:hypothetical protein